MTKPLRDLTQKNAAWFWGPTQQTAMENVKKAVASTPVLGYYSLDDNVTLRCSASKSDLRAALIQNGQPVAYASCALTQTEERYAQIEKELLAIVFTCERFEPYIYGLQAVQVETDCKPLESIVKKPLNAASKRLQRMLLRLQKYDLMVGYKKGAEMYLADTPSREFLQDISACTFQQGLEQVGHRELLPFQKRKRLVSQHQTKTGNWGG